MSSTPIFLLFVFVNSAFSDKALVQPCGYRDIECLSKSTEDFLGTTRAGIPDYNIKAIDPIVINHVEYSDPGSDLVMHFRNTTVTGLSQQKMTDVKMDITSKSVVLQTRVEVDILSDLAAELKEPAKYLSGIYNAKATAILIVNYNYDLKQNDKGMEYFEVGPETIACESVGVPEVSLDQKLSETLSNDPDAVLRKADFEKRASEIRSKAVCQILTRAYAVVISNLRTAAKLLPKTSFFTDI